MSSTRSPIDIIKERTAEAHESVEATMGARFFEDELDAEIFHEMLCAYYGIYAPLDARLAPLVEARLAEFPYLHRADRIARDLRTLGDTEADIADLPTVAPSALPSPESTPELLGCLYVIEGSAMGNQLIRRQLEATLADDLLEADAFFHRDGSAASRRWQQFRPLFDRRVDPGPPLDSAVEMASATFALYEEWFR